VTQPNAQPDPNLIETAYDPSMLTSLPLKELGTFEIGQEIGIDCCPPHHMLALLEGRIRLLAHSPEGAVYTHAMLEPGDLWDRQSWDVSDTTWVVSDTVRLGAMPVSAVQQFPFLEVCVERSRKKIQTVPDGTVLRMPSVSPQIESPVFRQNDVLQDVLSYLKIPANDGLDSVSDLESLMDALADHRLKSQILTLTWAELQGLSAPWVLEGADGQMHCVTAIKDQELVTRTNGRVRKVPVERRGRPKYWHVLVLRKPASSSKSGRAFTWPSQKPFTLAWYATLLLNNGLASSQMLIASFMIQVFSLGMPIFYMVIFDRVFGRQNLNTLDIMAVGMGLVLFSDLVVRGIRSLVLTHLLVWVDRVSMDAMLDMIFRLPLTSVSRDMIRRCGEMYHDLIKANESVVSLFLTSSLDAAFSSIMVLVLLNLHWQMALISLASLVPLAILALITTPQIKARAQQFSKAQRTTQLCLTEALENWETLHSYNALPTTKDRIRQTTSRMLNASTWARFDSVSGSSLSGFISALGSLATLYFGAHEVLHGTISYGAYAAINLMSRNVVSSIQKLFSSFLQFQENAGRLEKYQEVTDEILQVLEGAPIEERSRIITPAVQGQIEIRNLQFHYPSDTAKSWMMGPVNLTIQPGQKVVLTGAPGSGKTTLVRLIQGLYAPTQGAITLDGYRLSEFDAQTRNSLIGVALQRPAFLSGTVLENLTLENPDAPMKDVLDAVRLAQLDMLIDKLPKGLDSPVAPMGMNLPPAFTIRLALARVFINKPSILILDKALDALEPGVQAAIFSPVLQAYAKSTCIFVTDFLPVHQQADRIIVLRDGGVVEDGTFQSLIQARGHYYHLHVVDKTFSKQG
jgi:ATP-binding cassette, subfamily B, bacterial HlyB/CyaB